MAIGDGLDEERKRILAAMAQAGSEGVAAYKAGQAEVGSVQQQGLASAARSAALLNVNGEGAAQLAGIVAQPGILAQTYLAAGQDRYARDTARQLTANDDYMKQATAAVPAIQADADRQIGLLKAKWEEQRQREAEAEAKRAKAEQDALTQGELTNYAQGAAEQQRTADLSAVDQRRQALLTERDSLNKQQEAARKAILAPSKAPATTPAAGDRGYLSIQPGPEQQAARKQLDDIAARREAIDAQIAQMTGQPEARPSRSGGGWGRSGRIINRSMIASRNAGAFATAPLEAMVAPAYQYQREAAVGAGVNPNIAAGMFAPPKPSEILANATAEEQLANYQASGYKTPQAAVSAQRTADPATYAIAAKAGINPDKVATVRKSRSYKQAKEMAEVALSKGDPLDELKFALNGSFYARPDTIRLILAEYGPRFTGSSFIPEE